MFFNKGEFNLDNFSCPLDECRRKLTEKTASLFIEDFQTQYDQYLKQGVIFGQNQNERMISCFNIDCNSNFIIWKDADTFVCPNCKLQYCLKCKLKKHDGLKCMQALRLNQLSKTRILFLDTVKQSKMQQICPHCLIVVEKTGGCNFMTCKSKTCKSKKYFCFRCGEPLKQCESASHFYNGNSFDGQCNLKLNGKWVEVDKLPENAIPCPICLNVNPLKSKIEGNLLICNSEKCSDKIYCHCCKIQLNNKNILDHLEPHNKIIKTSIWNPIKKFFSK
ncbi:unnamed protein product (macronuclear) [Paramecium tetraurelia]|uniref:RBR-type E3 ubiquitin transferase n=1 Tax=Paramecium tetraurelia TaxID=5888 RepID=A0DQV0_PARTE|nr:uncharacterized protein GSPATT00002817001 [Paramecium tetraurelia]CAK85417.1 unnamed protein product [Paramecium tetraurelia]|eukprot:XP_001452814.1 hypothetical protein (macronuclear) [Paramecium tetraurelia strain d4-2]